MIAAPCAARSLGCLGRQTPGRIITLGDGRPVVLLECSRCGRAHGPADHADILARVVVVLRSRATAEWAAAHVIPANAEDHRIRASELYAEAFRLLGLAHVAAGDEPPSPAELTAELADRIAAGR